MLHPDLSGYESSALQTLLSSKTRIHPARYLKRSPASHSEDPCCPLNFELPPQMYKPEQVLFVPDDLEAGPMDLYLSAAELQPTQSLPLEFSDDLDVVGDDMQCTPSPLLSDPSLMLEDHSVKEIVEGSVDILG